LTEEEVTKIVEEIQKEENKDETPATTSA